MSDPTSITVPQEIVNDDKALLEAEQERHFALASPLSYNVALTYTLKGKESEGAIIVSPQ